MRERREQIFGIFRHVRGPKRLGKSGQLARNLGLIKFRLVSPSLKILEETF